MTKKTILLTGGGTLGSVTTLLALVPHLQKKGYAVHWVGTVDGPERELVEAAGIPFSAIRAPKFRRYFTWKHLLMPYELVKGCMQAFQLLYAEKPAAIVTAGGFVSVPVVWMGWVRKVPALIHQQDVQLGLANFLMTPCATAFTVTFEASMKHFPRSKTLWTGNPVRDLTPTTHVFALDTSVPTVLVFGGGTGAHALNALVSTALCEIANVIHSTGKGKAAPAITHPRYHHSELLGEEMKEALRAATVVVCRAGLGTIAELSALRKPAIVVPLPGTHQERNAALLRKQHAAIVCEQKHLTPTSLVDTIRTILVDTKTQQQLGEAIGALNKPNSARAIAERVVDIALPVK
jgi:UDP-N-acetylglucosamine--N-acetylmuramyl-(pentapeptide) pyrophosphoryl-undecaprenol N-acetylglucosamine transferase